MREKSGGSGVGRIKLTAVNEGGEWRLYAEKMLRNGSAPTQTATWRCWNEAKAVADNRRAFGKAR